jgi:hypothetical protein
MIQILAIGRYYSIILFADFEKFFVDFAVKYEVFKFPIFILFVIVLSFLDQTLSGQEEKTSDIISSIAEELAENTTDPEAVAVYLEKLHDLNENPVKLNSADESEMSLLFFLTEFQIKSLMDYIHTTGRILSVYEIANIPGFNREQAELIIPFISLDADNPHQMRSSRFKGSMLSNLSVKSPNSDSTSEGSPWKSLTKIKFTAGKLYGGFTAEKDAGEELLVGNPPMIDFMSANLAWTGSSTIHKIIIGDYGAKFGMGACINTSLRAGLSLTQTGYITGGEDIKPYTSTDENSFFRGMAVELKFKNTGISFFCSFNSLDATVDTAENGYDMFISTFQKSGAHNTISTRSAKDAVQESLYGINLVSDFKNIRIGILWAGSRFSIPVKTDNSNPEELYDFEGSLNYNASIYYKALSGNILLYGEASADINKRTAFVQGLAFRPSDRLSFNLLYRNYSPGFTAFHGKGPFSSSSGDNLKGFFGNFSFEATKHVFITAGCDIKYYPWLKYRCIAPSLSINREIRLKYLPSDRLTFEFLYSYRSTMLDNQENNGIKKQSDILNSLFKSTMRYTPVDNINLTTRIDYKITEPGTRSGILLLQDINYMFSGIPLSVWFRYCLYKTDDWDTRLYVYENDLLYSFNIPALYSTGSRSCIMVTWKAGRLFYLRLKYGISESIQNADNINQKSELRMQFRILF